MKVWLFYYVFCELIKFITFYLEYSIDTLKNIFNTLKSIAMVNRISLKIQKRQKKMVVKDDIGVLDVSLAIKH